MFETNNQKNIKNRLEKLEKYIGKLKNNTYMKKGEFYANKTIICRKILSLKEENKMLNLEIENLKIDKNTKKIDDLKNEINIIKNDNLKKQRVNQKKLKVIFENIQKALDIINYRLLENKKKEKELKTNKKLKYDLEICNIKNEESLITILKKDLENYNYSKNINKENILGKSIDDKNKIKIPKKVLDKGILKFEKEIKKHLLDDNEIKYIKFKTLKNMINNKNIKNDKIIPYINNNQNILNFIDNNNHSILYDSVINCNKEVINLLYKINKIRFHENEFIYDKKLKENLEKIINFFDSENYKEKILEYAFKNNLVKILKNLFLKYEKINLNVICKEIPNLFEIVNNDNVEIIKIIIQEMIKRRSIDYKDDEDLKLIGHCIKKSNNLEIFKFIFDLGVCINENDRFKNKIIHYATQYNNNLNIIKYLIKKGANINDKNNFGSTPLHNASKCSNNLNIIKYLIEKGANINDKTYDGWTPIHFVARYNNNLNIIKYLIEKGANVNSKTYDDITPIHFASCNKNFEILKYLILLNKKNIHFNDKNGRNAIYYSCLNNLIKNIKNLLSLGADLYQKDIGGKSGFDYLNKKNKMILKNLKFI